ncbi:hypothetical protein ACTA71_000147 [Dictyostelium dimigraforme]
MSYPFPGVEAGVGVKIGIEAFKNGIKLAIRLIITRMLTEILSKGAITSILKNGMIDANSQNAIELKSRLGDMAFRKVTTDLFDIENRTRTRLIELVRRRIEDQSKEMYNNEYFKKLKKFVDDINRKPTEPQEPERICKHLKKFDEIADASSLVIEFIGFILNKFIYEDEVNENGEITGNKILTTQLYSSLLIPVEEWEKLISSPYISRDVIQLMEMIMELDPRYSSSSFSTIKQHIDREMGGVDENQRSLRSAGYYLPSTDVIKIMSVRGRKLVNIVGTSSDNERETSWVKFWEAVTNNCDSTRICRIQTESPVYEDIHNPVTRIVGGHVRMFGDIVRDTFLILPICNSHNIHRRFDEDQDGSPYLVASLTAFAAEIAAVKLKKRKYHSLGFNEFNSTLEKSLNDVGLIDYVKESIEKEYFDIINPLVKEATEESIEWMEKHYAPSFDDLIPIIGDIKTIYQMSTMQSATLNKFQEIVNEKFGQYNPNIKMDQSIEKLISDNSINFDLAISLFNKRYYTEEFY